MTKEQAEKEIRYTFTKVYANGIIEALEQPRKGYWIDRQRAQNRIKEICNKYRLSYEDGERIPATGGSAYALGHAFDDLPSLSPQSIENDLERLQKIQEVIKSWEDGTIEEKDSIYAFRKIREVVESEDPE